MARPDLLQQQRDDIDNRPYEKYNEDGAPFRPYPIECIAPRMVVLNDEGKQFDVMGVEESFDGCIWVEGYGTGDSVVVGFPPVDLWGRPGEGKRVWVAVCKHCYFPLVASDKEALGTCYDPDCFAGQTRITESDNERGFEWIK